MPNIVAHNHLTHMYMRTVTPNLALGSVLPDFAGMYRDYHGENVGIKNISQTIDMGIYIHHKSDRIFDAQPQKPQMTENLSAHLVEVGLKPRAARLGAHLLADVMLDGVLMSQHEPRADYETLGNYILDEETWLHGRHFPEGFRQMVCGYFEREIPDKYHDPRMLAKITQRRLNFRAARFGGSESIIPESYLQAMSEVIDIQTERIHHLGQIALDRTIEILQSEPTYI